MTDLINNPAHYQTESGLEAIDVIEAFFENDHYLATTFKYIARAGKKDGAPTLQDLKKGEFYLKRKIARVEAAEKQAELKEFNESVSKAIEEMVRQSLGYPQRYVVGLDTTTDTAQVEEPIEAEFEDIPEDFVPEPAEPKVGDKISAIAADTHSLATGEIGEIETINGIYFKVRRENGLSSWLIRKEFTLVEEELKPEEPTEPAPRLKPGDKVKVDNDPRHGENHDGWVSDRAAGQIGTILHPVGEFNFEVLMPDEDNLRQTIGGRSLARVFDYIEEVPVGLLVKDRDGDTLKIDEDGDVFIAYTGTNPGSHTGFNLWEYDEHDDNDYPDDYAPFIEILEEN